MPEFMGKKITRAEESARHAYRQALDKAVRAQAKGAGWRTASGLIFREQAGWFIDLGPRVHIYERVTKAAVSVKPMAIDPIFWDIMGLPENRDQPLSFRANGAWVCRPPYLAEIDIEEDDDPGIVASRFLALANDQLEMVQRSYSIDAFLAFCGDAARERDKYLPCVITTLIALDRATEARAVCEEAAAQGLNGGFRGPDGSFVDLAAAFLRRPHADAARD